MKRIVTICCLIFLLFISIRNDASACTIFKITKEGKTFIGNNEDGMDSTTYIWFIPGSKGKFGRVYFTLSDKWPQGGMNDQGLFYDGTSGPWKNVVNSSDKPEYQGNLSEKMLEECSTVPEAISLLKKYNLSYFKNGQMLIADKDGNSAIVEGDTIVYGTDYYQIATNFYHSRPDLGGYPCYRYDVAETMITNIQSLSPEIMKTILQAVHLEGYSRTQYSTIYDLANLTIHYYKDSDFNNYVTIDLKKELQKGEKWYETNKFFQLRPITQNIKAKKMHFDNIENTLYGDNKIKCALRFMNDLLGGISECFYKNGNTSWRAIFKNGRISDSLKNWSETGTPVIGYDFPDDKHTIILDYYPDGSLFLRLTLLKTGEDRIEPNTIVSYNEDGTLNYQGIFKNNLFFLKGENKPFTGELSSYFKNGNRFILTKYNDGKLHGQRIQWDKNGKIKIIEEYKNGNLIGIERYGEK